MLALPKTLSYEPKSLEWNKLIDCTKMSDLKYTTDKNYAFLNLINQFKDKIEEQNIRWIGEADLEFEHSINKNARDIPQHWEKITKVRKGEAAQSFNLASVVTCTFFPVVSGIALWRSSTASIPLIVFACVCIFLGCFWFIFAIMYCFVMKYANEKTDSTAKSFNRINRLEVEKENN